MANPRDWEEQRVRDWITKNRGALARVAILCRCSHQFVHQMAYGRSTALAGHPVETALRKAGWPGIRRSRP